MYLFFFSMGATRSVFKTRSVATTVDGSVGRQKWMNRRRWRVLFPKYLPIGTFQTTAPTTRSGTNESCTRALSRTRHGRATRARHGTQRHRTAGAVSIASGNFGWLTAARPVTGFRPRRAARRAARSRIYVHTDNLAKHLGIVISLCIMYM